MKVGDILYFVDIKLGKVSKQKIVSIKENKSLNLNRYDMISFSHTGVSMFRSDLVLNPIKENFFSSYSISRNSRKSFLIFSNPEDAQQALVEYVIPKILEMQQKEADNLINAYNMLIGKVEETTNQLEKEKTNFNKKCNALKNKIV